MRNNCIIRNQPFDKEGLWQKFLFVAWLWLSGLKSGFQYLFSLWLANPGPCINYGI